MTLRINDTAPDFTARTNQGEIRFHDWIGDHWAILFSHPKDFTPVCTTEFGAVAQLADVWAARNTKVIGVSVDGLDEHLRWIGDIETVCGTKLAFPIIADEGLAVSKAYDMLPAEAHLPDGRTPADSATVRAVFIIDPQKKVRLTMSYPMTVGRNFAEIVRALDALQAADRHGLAMPADWHPGADAIVPATITTEAARAKYGEVEEILPYLRKVRLPAA